MESVSSRPLSGNIVVTSPGTLLPVSAGIPGSIKPSWLEGPSLTKLEIVVRGDSPSPTHEQVQPGFLDTLSALLGQFLGFPQRKPPIFPLLSSIPQSPS